MTLNLHLSQRGILGITIAMAATFFFTLTSATWQWQHDWALAHQNSGKMPTIDNLDQSSEMLTTIRSSHLFGANTTKLGNMPISSQQLRLIGIVKVDSDQLSVSSKAYISIAGAPGKIYKIGDVLPYGVKVFDISSDAVILQNDGHLEKLPLPRDELKFKPILDEEHA